MKNAFLFNLNGVCSNPECIIIHQVSSREYGVIRLAKTPSNDWGFGFDIQMNNSSQITGVSQYYSAYSTREKALTEGLLYLLRVCDRHAHRSDYNAFAEAIKDYQNSTLIKPLLPNGSTS